ncbi:SE1561 family protein [Alteribacillus sp. HJP-4]|uniref:SE1561 family protein n=1 Tax=Alteribacillus sp. HJP-4 TaxID=2775394 RepID=UPI0035CCC945
MSTPIHDKNKQIIYLQQRLQLIQEMLENLDPVHSGTDDLQRLEAMFEQLQIKLKQFKHDWE